MHVMVSANDRRPQEQNHAHRAGSALVKELLTPLELADRWGVTTGHLANLRHHGEGIGYLKLGSRVAYRLADVLAYEESVYVQVSAGAHMSA